MTRCRPSVRAPARCRFARFGRGAPALADALGEIGVEVVYLGREVDARRIAQHAADERADAVEVCLSGVGGVSLLRALIRELRLLDRAETGIVVHRVW